ncbi:MAG: Smr/MutS family protein [Hyphomicrobiaceae bacterium]
MSRGGRKRGGHLSDDDVAVWASVSQGVEPLKAKSRVAARQGDDHPRPARSQQEADRPAAPPRRARAIDTTVRPVAAPPPVTIERRKARRIASGRIEIDARIDLHGQRQLEAHRRLVAFLLRAQSEGFKTVLVITGKGRTREEDDLGPRETGVLRQNVPRWLDEPELRPLVVGYSTAHARHGGEGALYVEIRRRRG